MLVEAGHRCAIPTCRHIDVDIHHIVPWSETEAHDYDDLIALCPNCHRRADRGDIDRKSLRIYKANLRYAHDKFSQFEMDTLFDLGSIPENYARPFPEYLGLLIKRLLDAEFVQLLQPSSGMAIGTASGTLNIGPSNLIITKKGRAFLKDLGTADGERPSPWWKLW